MKKVVLFDFDGVIADSFQVAMDVNRSLDSGITEEEYRRAMQGNPNDWARHRGDGEGITKHFFEAYLPRMEQEVGLFKGMDEVVKKLSRQYLLIIISSTVTEGIQDFLQRTGLHNCFEKVMGNDVHHSKVEKFKMAFDEYGFNEQDCVFITDTLGDMREAEQVGIGTIGVTWGFHSSETLKQGNCFRIIDRVEDIPSAVSDYFTS